MVPYQVHREKASPQLTRLTRKPNSNLRAGERVTNSAPMVMQTATMYDRDLAAMCKCLLQS